MVDSPQSFVDDDDFFSVEGSEIDSEIDAASTVNPEPGDDDTDPTGFSMEQRLEYATLQSRIAVIFDRKNSVAQHVWDRRFEEIWQVCQECSSIEIFTMLNEWINATYGELQDRVNPTTPPSAPRRVEPEPPPADENFHPTVPRCYREALFQLPQNFTEQHFIMGFGKDVREVSTTLCAMKVPYVTRLVLLAHWPQRR